MQPNKRKSTARATTSATKRQKKGKQQQDDKDKNDENDGSSNHDNDPLYQECSHLAPRLSSEETFQISFKNFLPIMQEWKEKHGTANVPHALRKIHGGIVVLANGKEVNATDIPKGLPLFMGK